jgi:hypothetical protein
MLVLPEGQAGKYGMLPKSSALSEMQKNWIEKTFKGLTQQIS